MYVYGGRRRSRSTWQCPTIDSLTRCGRGTPVVVAETSARHFLLLKTFKMLWLRRAHETNRILDDLFVSSGTRGDLW